MRITASKNLPHRENGSPASTSTGGPRTTPRRGSRPLTGWRRPWSSITRLASAGASAPAAGVSLVGGHSTTTGQRPRRLGLSPATHRWCRGRLAVRDGPTRRRRGRGVGAGAVRSAWPLLWRSSPGGVDGASRWTLEDPVEARHHPLRVVAVIIAVSAVVLTGGFFFRLPPSAWTWLDAPPAIGGRDSFSSSLSSLSPWRTSVSQRTSAACHGRPRPPLLEASRIGRQLVPVRAKTSLKKEDREIQNRSRIQGKNAPGRPSPRRASWGSH